MTYEKICLKARRINAGMTRKELAEETGIPIQSLLRIENGKQKATSDEINKLINFFQMPYEAFNF